MRLALFGLPGAGKGTQAEMLSKHFGVPHISTGDLFREMLISDTDLGREVKKIVTSGELVSDDLVTRIAFNRLSFSDCKNGFILDGYPRTLVQANSLLSSDYMISHLILIEVVDSEIINRLSGRRLCQKCNTIFHISNLVSNDGKYICPQCEELLVQRPDDKIEVIQTRLKLFNDNMSQVFDFFDERKLMLKVNGNKAPKEVFKDILNAL
jgi:adenylate kinase